jgi:hypothetical protein
MTPEELQEIEDKYRAFLPLDSAKKIIALIEYTRKLERENATMKRQITHINHRVSALVEELSC